MRAARRANNWLLRNGLTTIKQPNHYLEALFDVQDGDVTGILCFFRDDEDAFYVSIAWVDGRQRKSGVFRKLMAALVRHAKTNHATSLNTEVKAKNTRMMEVMSRHWDTSYVFFTKEFR